MYNSQAGRSMIEMLGVLAVIGVLSVGGLVGYSKMMTQHMINTSMQQINLIAAKISAVGGQTSSYDGLDNASAIKLGAVPAETIDGDSELRNPFGGTITIASSFLLEDKSDTQAYIIKYSGLPVEACLSLASTGWNNAKSSSLLGIGVGAGAENSIYQGCPGTASVACPEGETTSLPMSISKARAACNCTTDCTIVIKFF